MRERRKRWRVIEGHFEIRNMLEHVLTPSTKFVGKKILVSSKPKIN